MARLSKTHHQAWTTLFEAHARILVIVDRELAEAGLPPHSWYDLLYRLHRSPAGRARMHEIADDVVMSRSGLTRLADRLEVAGLIARRRCPVDRRGTELELLPAGVEMLRAIWSVYADVLARTFGTHVADPEALGASLAPLRAALYRPDQPCRASGAAAGSAAAPA